MSTSVLRQLLARLFSRFLKFIGFIRRILPVNLINNLFALLRQWARTNPHQSTHHRRRGLPTSAPPESGVVCAMNVPSSVLSGVHEHAQHSPVDSPYTSSRSPSGHLIPPSITVGPSRVDIPRILRSQVALCEEPNGIRHDTHAATNSILLSSSSTTVCSHRDSYTPRPDSPAFSSRTSSPYHYSSGAALETRPGTPESITSVISRISIHSIERTPYQEHPDLPVCTRNPDAGHHTLVGPLSSSAPPTAQPGRITASPSVTNQNRLGEVIGTRFAPTSANCSLRYYRRETRQPYSLDYKIEAMMYRYPETREGTPEGWAAFRHPEGGLYFVHSDSKTFTEVNICKDVFHKDIEYFRTFLFSQLQTEIEQRGLSEVDVDEVQLVLTPVADDQGVVCCYYFVNPRTRSLFWLDEWQGYEVFKNCRGVLSSPHKGLAIQADYWRHWDLFPNFCEVTQELKDEVMDLILYVTSDRLTSEASTFPLTYEELLKYLTVVERININPERTGNRKHSAIIIGRIMNMLYSSSFINFHGEDCARLNSDQTVYGWRYHPSKLMSILAPLLFMTPIENVRLLHRMFVDRLVCIDKWNTFVLKLNSQFQETSVLATVLLNANVGFLPKEPGTGTTPQQFLTYMSLAASIASMILGLVLMGHIRTEARTKRSTAAFLGALWHEKHGLERLAVIYSLPHAFLIWAMGLFSAALVAQWFDGGYPGDGKLRAGGGALMFFLVLLVVWSVWTVRGHSDFWWFQPDPNQPERRDDEVDSKAPSDDRIDPNNENRPPHESYHMDTRSDLARSLGRIHSARPSEAGFSV